MHFDLQDLYENRGDPQLLKDLEKPSTHEEIDEVVKNLPSDKAPRPDGFNGDFIRACWDILAKDFYQLIQDFHEGKISLQSINASFITLVPKKDSPLSTNDYKPISLLNCTIKIITKLLANRLQTVISKLVHKISMVSLSRELFRTAWPGVLNRFTNANNLRGPSVSLN